MLPVLFSVGPITIHTFGVFAALAFISASFLAWRKLREDYHEEEILSYAILATLFAILGGRISYLAGHFFDFGLNVEKWLLLFRFPGLSLPGAFLGAVIFSAYWIKRKNWDVWIVGDGIVFAVLSALILGSIGAYLSDGSLSTLADLVLAVLTLGVAILLFPRYRKFIWYKTGRPGFVMCVTAMFYFLVFSGLDFYFRRGVYLDQAGGLAIAVLAFIFLYRQSGRKFSEEFTFRK